MAIERFEDIIAWQKTKVLTVKIYSVFSQSKDFGFRDQIQRVSVSIMNNIAEGFERKGNKEFKYFLNVAKGSCGEVRSMLILAVELGKLEQEQFQELKELSVDVSKLITGLMKVL
ncbi:four helix bundle protein [Labilibacter marinus]|uniref:four helix bundle protein n=1 Tax=Labilibacter marinus TaxID=1477105 RepID=UPI00094F8B7C|nr:four helix bundle protein [Labilibacter marinus]